MAIKALFRTILLAIAVACCGQAAAGKYVRLSPELQLYYEEAGKGSPIVFIPGWAATTRYYKAQLDHFSKQYRAISYDPRSQGRSTKTPQGNHYMQHGADLRAFLLALNLTDVVLVGHSWGCHDAYAYFRAFGTDRIRAFVCIDSSPKSIVEKDGDWGTIKAAGDLKPFHDGLIQDRASLTREFLQAVVSRPLTEPEKRWFIDQLAETPTPVAVLLDYDGQMVDYTAEAKAIDGKIPVLNVLANPGWFDGWTQAGKAWLAANAPHSEVADFGLHALHWEFPDRFNAVVDDFLRRTAR